MKDHFLFVCILLLILLGGACSPSPRSENAAADKPATSRTFQRESGTSGDIYIAVDESFQPIMEAQIANFMGLYPDAKVTAIYLPGEDAIEAMLNSDSIRLVIATRELTREEERVLEAQTTSAKPSRLATDAIALVVNRDNQDTILTRDQMIGILTGEIASWKEINPESPLDDITLVFDNAQSSTVRYMQDSVIQGKTLTEKVFAADTNPEVLEYVAKTPNALGIIGVAWISDQDDEKSTGFKENVSVVKLESEKDCSYGGKFFQPYQGFIFEQCYPLRRGVFAILRESSFGLGTGFVSYLASDPGQRIILKAGLVPDRSPTRVTKWPSKREKKKAAK